MHKVADNSTNFVYKSPIKFISLALVTTFFCFKNTSLPDSTNNNTNSLKRSTVPFLSSLFQIYQDQHFSPLKTTSSLNLAPSPSPLAPLPPPPSVPALSPNSPKFTLTVKDYLKKHCPTEDQRFRQLMFDQYAIAKKAFLLNRKHNISADNDKKMCQEFKNSPINNFKNQTELLFCCQHLNSRSPSIEPKTYPPSPPPILQNKILRSLTANIK